MMPRHLLPIMLIPLLCHCGLTRDVAPPPARNPAATSHLQPGQVFRDRLADGTEGPAMVVIPAGEFWMGAPEHEAGRYRDEIRQQVQVARFAMGRFEVTFAEYDRFIEATGREKPEDAGWGRGRQPAIHVSWHDATAYAAWLSAQTGEVYRLPTEAEWEYAARAGSDSAYWWGDGIGVNRANCHGCGSPHDNTRAAPVGSFEPNAFGLYDTVGNVWEWTCSAYDADYEGLEQRCRERGHGNRVFRGGAWADGPRWVRVAHRHRDSPTGYSNSRGFRLARSL